jgi:hypothetical protein
MRALIIRKELGGVICIVIRRRIDFVASGDRRGQSV